MEEVSKVPVYTRNIFLISLVISAIALSIFIFLYSNKVLFKETYCRKNFVFMQYKLEEVADKHGYIY